jgi:hypothetical protein
MAQGAQGSVIRRASSVVSTAGNGKGLNIVTGTTDKINATALAGIDFTVGGQAFSIGQRIIVSGATTNIGVYTVKTVAATVIETYELGLVNENTSFLELKGYTMTDIGQVVSWSGPNEKAAVMDVTHLQSTAKEKMISVRDSGQVSLDIFFNPEGTQHQLLKKDMINKTARYFDIVLNDSASLDSYYWFKAYVSGFSIQGSVDNPIKGSVTLDITAGVEYTTRV